jgi:predicted nucleic acid-binding Zn ribbon protein
MATYVYETIPSKSGGKARRFEIKQSMKDAPLTKHPETGESIRRVLSGGFGLISSGKSGSKNASTPRPRGGGSCCGASCGCH